MTMRVSVLSATVQPLDYQFLPSYLINETVVIDAGSLGFAEIDLQRGVQSVFLSHSHLDHTASLPMFLDNVYQPGPDCPTVYASETVIDVLKRNFFNDAVWPDIDVLSQQRTPFAHFIPIRDSQPIGVDGLFITPVSLDHCVPTFGFVVDDGTSAVALVSDTSPTTAIWKLVAANPRVKAVFLECAFPDSLGWLAKEAMHLTPALFRDELAKIGRDLPVVAIHIKPAHYDTVVSELCHLGLKSLHISQANDTFVY
jgi:cAMP phosphodiesterase